AVGGNGSAERPRRKPGPPFWSELSLNRLRGNVEARFRERLDVAVLHRLNEARRAFGRSAGPGLRRAEGEDLAEHVAREEALPLRVDPDAILVAVDIHP